MRRTGSRGWGRIHRVAVTIPESALALAALVCGILALATACVDGRASESSPADGAARDGEGAVGTGSTASATRAAPVARDTMLERLGAELLPAAERRSGLEARGPVALARSSRDRLETFLIAELEEELPPEKARAITAVYARLGLLPPELDLRELLTSLYLEQVVGYYDPEADTLYVREGVPPAQLRPVLLHEIVHALQDQHTDLDSLMEALSEDNDAAMAARAAVEGHATFAMLEWQLAQTAGPGTDMAALPDLGGLLSGIDLAGAAGMPVLSEAPRLIRESLLFPYVGGLTFVQRYWKSAEGRPAPLNENLPASTEQVIHPERFLPPGRDAPARIRFERDAPPGWEIAYSDGLGELETRVLLSTFLSDTARASAAAAGWDGDRYRLLRRGGSADRGEAAPDTNVLAWASVWDSDEDANDFADAVEEALGERYRRPVHGERGDAGGGAGAAAGDADRVVRVLRPSADRPAVLVIDAPAVVMEGLDRGAFDFSADGGR